jgi:hypothetical protein
LNIVVSVAAGVLSAGFAKMIGCTALEVLLFGVFSFLATLAVYNGQRLFKSSEIETPWLIWVGERKQHIQRVTVVASILAFALSIALIYERDFIYIAAWMAPAALISFLYVFRIGGKNLRDVPYLKIHLIAFAWVSVLILFPFFTRFYLTEDFLRPFMALVMGHYMYIVAVAVPFDIRDLKYDRASQKTIPQVLGVHGSKLLSVGLLIASAIFLSILTPIRSDNVFFYLAIGVQIVLVLFMHPARSDAYCAGWIDGAISLLGIAYFLN